jgi:hypothetical protein
LGSAGPENHMAQNYMAQNALAQYDVAASTVFVRVPVA